MPRIAHYLKTAACALVLGLPLAVAAADLRPTFSPAMLGDAKRLLIAERPMPANYIVWQTTVAMTGLAKDLIDGGNTWNTPTYSKAVSELPEHHNLYDHLQLRLSEEIQSHGFEVVRVVHHQTPMSCNPLEVDSGESDWVFCVDAMMIRYYATTMLSSYMPQANIVIVPYNVRTKTVFQRIVVKATAEPKDGSFFTADALMKRLPSSYSTLEAATESAARLATEQLVGKNK